MALEPITTEIIFELMYISLGLSIFGLILNKILGLKSSVMKEIRVDAKNLQDRLKQAQVLGDPRIMQELQAETMQLMKQMLKKQFLPMGIRCIIFLGIFFILSFYYGGYEYWYWVYFLWSLGFSLSVFGLTKAYKKVTGKEEEKKSLAKEIAASLGQRSSYFISNVSSIETQDSQIDDHTSKNDEENQESEESDSWKDRLQN
ncbi:MAG: hypothetical protein ACTSPS_11650 [Promethearchaeota archaeon]|jgi:hypothetical protein